MKPTSTPEHGHYLITDTPRHGVRLERISWASYNEPDMYYCEQYETVRSAAAAAIDNMKQRGTIRPVWYTTLTSTPVPFDTYGA